MCTHEASLQGCVWCSLHAQMAHLALIEVHKGHKLDGVRIVVVVGTAAGIHPQLDEAPFHWRAMHCRWQRRFSSVLVQAIAQAVRQYSEQPLRYA